MKKPNRVWVIEFRRGDKWIPNTMSVYSLKINAEEAITTSGAPRNAYRVVCYEAKEANETHRQ